MRPQSGLPVPLFRYDGRARTLERAGVKNRYK